MRKAGRTRVAIAGILAASLALTAACSSSGSGDNSGTITLKVRLFGNFGYQDAGLFDQYEKEHPNIKIDYTTVEQEATYWTAFQNSLATGAGLGDVQGIEVGRISAVTSQLGDKFVDLNQYGAGDVKNDFYPWKFAAGSTADGKVIGLGTDIGPLALCYRADLFEQAGLPTAPDDVSALWADSGWDGFVAAGHQYQANAPAGSHWVDTAGGFFNAIIGQSENQYYDKDGNVIATTNPAVKAAWDESVKMTGDLSAALSQFSTAWNVAFTTGTFATIACPSWMIAYIKSEAGAMTGQWNVATIPGGAGNWGGSYIGVPAKSEHPAEAAALAKWLTSAEQEAAVFKAAGLFPSNSKAAESPDVLNATDEYFSGGTGDPAVPAPIGKIFGESAANLVVAVTGPHDGDIKNAITTALTRVETGQQSADDSWNDLISKDIPAVLG